MFIYLFSYSTVSVTMVMSADFKASVTGLLALSNKSAHIFSRSSLVTLVLKSTSSNKPSI